MADQKLSALTELAATPADDDEVYIRDVSEVAAAESKRITIANLLAGVVDLTGDEIVTLLEALAGAAQLSHTKISDVGAADHHTKYLDAEAVAAVEAVGLGFAAGKFVRFPSVISDLTWGGMTTLFIAGTPLTFGQLVYIAAADQKAELTDADAVSTMPALAIATATVSENNNGEFLLHGFIRNDSWNWTVGGFLYTSTTPGGLTQIAPSGTGDQVQVVGVARSANIILFNPSLVLVEIS